MNRSKEAIILGAFLFLGLTVLGYFISQSPASFKQYERTVVVKGLSEREVPADTVIWPIMFSVANNDVLNLYQDLEADRNQIVDFLQKSGFAKESISLTEPVVLDKLAQNYGSQPVSFRYTARQTVTLYSKDVNGTRMAKIRLADLGKTGVLITGDEYNSATEYLFTGLNDIKPEMVEEATQNAREVALKFARDSNSVLGKIKSARQGQFSISDRDKNNPHIKRVRVVSTVEYYLSD